MAARESAEVRAALADVQAGMSRNDAAARHGVALSSITRAMRRRELPQLPKGPRPSAPASLPEPYRFADGSPLVP
jgi:transposase